MAFTGAGFPQTEPAIVVKLKAGTANPFGTLSTGSNMVHIETPAGTIESVPGFEPAFKANFTFGADWLTFDPDRAHGRVNVRAVARTVDDDSPLHLSYNAVIRMTDDVWKIFGGSPDMVTVPFGLAVGHASFLAGDPKLKVLENLAFATSGRIIVGEDKSLTVETRISKVVAPEVMD
ncbi:hypothetical protein SLS58_007994 [Diplodia intermedia]|uniref:Uncharacterized protein n=1 Tax=Diplodia intermedia TaxID=856260 RepID=A0ABR3TIS7_9PEZI